MRELKVIPVEYYGRLRGRQSDFFMLV